VEIKASFEWILAWPNEPAAANSLIAAAHDRLDRWQVRLEGIGIDLPIPVCVGIPDVWPHMSELFEKGGYAPDRDSYEAVYGGSLDHIPPPGHPPIEGLEIKRTMGKFGTRFTALLDGKEVSRCECYADLTQGGRLPALANWSELSEIETADEWRNKGIGAWVVKHAIHWLRLAGCDRCVFSVGPEDEEAGAARFYSRFGWEPFVRERKWWTRREL
jgi:GNAT superfamily N-acetyltransferase